MCSTHKANSFPVFVPLQIISLTVETSWSERNFFKCFVAHHPAKFSLKIFEDVSINFCDISRIFKTCSRITPSKSSKKKSIDSPLSRQSNRFLIGTLVPKKQECHLKFRGRYLLHVFPFIKKLGINFKLLPVAIPAQIWHLLYSSFSQRKP